jgi:hypothetical protein
MKPRPKFIAAYIFIVGLSACAPVQQQSFTATPVRQPLIAGVGDVVLRTDGRESMPNIFGNADIFGRTRPTGFATVQFGGMQGEKVVLLRSGVTQSDATTMNSTPLVVPTQQTTSVYGTVGSRPVYGTSTTSGVTYIPPVGSTSTSSQQPTIPILVDWRSNQRVPALGKTIVIEAANSTSMTYHIE